MDVLVNILTFKKASELKQDASTHSEAEVQQAAHSDDDININPPSNTFSSSSESRVSHAEHSDSISLSSHLSEDMEGVKDDSSDNHLVSGSEHDVYMSENGLTHQAWYEETDEAGSSSDEDDSHDVDTILFSEEENKDDDLDDLYNSD